MKKLAIVLCAVLVFTVSCGSDFDFNQYEKDCLVKGGTVKYNRYNQYDGCLIKGSGE